MKRIAAFLVAALIATSLAVLAAVMPASADGTETLGVPSVPIQSGTGILTAGVGLRDLQPNSFAFNVPGTVKQVLLYWAGHFSQTLGGTGDPNIVISNGGPNQAVNGTLIGGPTQ